MEIAPKTVVLLTYELYTSKADSEKLFVETAKQDNPLVFLCGTGSMIPKFEQELLGKKAGDKFDFSIAHLDAYGPMDEEAIVKIPMDVFTVDGKVDTEMLKVGNMLPMRDSEGHQLNGKVLGIEPDAAIIDFNHPLAGQELHFKGEIILVREAEEEELKHGHAHPDGMHHD